MINYIINSIPIEIENKKITSVLGENDSIRCNIGLLLHDKYRISLVRDIFKISKKEYKDELLKLYNKFNIGEFLSLEEKVIIAILNVLDNDVIIIDDALSYLSNKNKKVIINYIRKHEITLINITTNVEEVLLGDNVILLTDTIAENGNVKDIIVKEKIFKALGIAIPFVVDLSIQLNIYELINKIYTDKTRLVGALWKQ